MRFGIVSTYPPTQCGLATFAAALREALVGGGADVGRVVRLIEAAAPTPSEEVVAQVVSGNAATMRRAVDELNRCAVAIVQHEYGVYGGRDGEEILVLLDQLRVPSIVVLHTVLIEPTTHQREILEAVVAKADAVVTMTRVAHSRLGSVCAVDMSKVRIIAHGAPELATTGTDPTPRTGRFTILTWGLIGPGKGIQWAIEAMTMLRDLQPAPLYVVAGQTHPKVLIHEGEAYRDRLRQQVRDAGIEPLVVFDGQYRDTAALASLIASSDVVLLPYDSTDQVTSGVLIEAVVAGKPVIATAFPHAVELLADGAGMVVAHRDPAAIAAALRSLISPGGLSASMAGSAASVAPQMAWPAIAEQYRALASELIEARMAA